MTKFEREECRRAMAWIKRASQLTDAEDIAECINLAAQHLILAQITDAEFLKAVRS